MKKRILAIMMSTVLVMSLAACGGSSTTATTAAPTAAETTAAAADTTAADTTAAAADTTAAAAGATDLQYTINTENIGEHTFTFSSTSAPGSVGENIINEFSRRVEELSGGKMHVNHFGGSTLGTEAQNLEALTAGTLDMSMIAVEFYCNSIPQLGALLLPYVYEDYDQVSNVLMSEAGDYANEQILKEADVVNLCYFIQAFREIYCTKEIKTADDLKGVKIRVPESSLYVNTFTMLGAAPTPLPLSEVYTAMDTGVVDAVENIPDTAVHNSWAEVAPYMIVTNHLNAPSTFSMSNKVFQTLNEDEQNVLLQAGYENFFYSLALSQEKDKEGRDELAKTMTVVEPDIESMRAKIDYNSYDFMQMEEAQKLFELVKANLNK